MSPQGSRPADDRPVDAVDIAILRVLRDRGRISVTELAEQAHVSRSNAHARVGRLVDDGVITHFGAHVDPHKVGLPLCALVLVSVEQTKLAEIRSAFDAMPEIEQWGFSLGEFDGFAFVRVADNEALRTLVVERLRTVPGIRQTNTVFVIEESGHRPALP